MKLTPFLMFQHGHCAAATELYLRVFDDATLDFQIMHPAPQQNLVMRSQVSIHGQAIALNDSPIEHAFDFTPSQSFFIDCDDASEVDRIAEELGAGGATLMPADAYGFSERFAWVNDRYGVSWQLNYQGEVPVEPPATT
ncbi:VOC family protein [Micrococcoides hystricis]|uniref:VOC family protein n=1 Tax=Micrococcoides hystricis TaxID=1572761 RepID=A0ABV6P6Z1_9MICC